MDITCISDLHGHYPELEGGDLLIVAGDLTASDKSAQYVLFMEWLDEQEYLRKVIVGGNHDNLLDKGRFRIGLPEYYPASKKIDYLCDSGTEFEGLKIWGSPWTKAFDGMNPNCKAFTVDTEEELADKFELIPRDIDILVTHSPPRHILDKTAKGKHVGSGYLYGWLKYCGRPRVHAFGHIHEAYGQTEYFSCCRSINCSHVNEYYQPVNKPIRIIL